MSKESKLLHIAENQNGYFSAKQAEECGYARTNFHRNILSGKWLKELRGIYRLTNFPTSPHQEFTLWTLWSADKQGKPQGIICHESALELHGLSDISSAKIHLCVPKNFRKSTKLPKNIYLHYSDEIPSAEIEIRQGFRVTTPLRTLKDIIHEGRIQTEQIELAILDLAIQKSLIKGLSTIQEMEQLQHFTDSKEIQEIIAKAIDQVWTRANTQLEEFGRALEPYTISLYLENQGFGSAVLCQHGSQQFLLTASHVGKAIHKAKSITLILRFDNIRREYPVHSTKSFTVLDWDSTFEEKMLDDVPANQPKDLAIVIPSKTILDILKTYKAFYKIPENPPSFSLQEAFISLGGIESYYSKENKTWQLQVGPYGFMASNYSQFHDADYITCPISNHTYEMRNLRRKKIDSFEGLSGSGLWKFTDNTPNLIGIAIAQDPSGYNPISGVRNVYFHGPQSIRLALSVLGKIYDSKN